MATAKFNENGVLVNSDTGEEIGNKSGNTTVINSAGAEMKTLEDYGVLLPDFPEEENTDEKEDDEDFKAVGIRSRSDGDSNASAEGVSSKLTHIDNGISSYSVKKTKYEVTKDSYFVVKFGLVQKSDGRFIPIKEEMVEEIPDAEPHWVKFRMWTYDEELKWKSECMEYNSSTKLQMINQDKLNERKLRNLILDWSFGSYEDRLKLLHCDGRLSDESFGIIRGMYPSIVITIMDLMNLVLESNQ
jgi:hypothetical protein